MRTLLTSAAVLFLAAVSALPMNAQNGPLAVTAFVENQVCLSKDFVQVTLSASATSDTQPVGYRWDTNNDGKPDTKISTDPSTIVIYGDELSATAKVVALNKGGERAQNSITFTTLKCR